MAYFLDNYPIHPDSRDLVLTEEEEKNLRIVYKLDGKGGAVLCEPWDSDAAYSDEYVVVPIRSTGATPVPAAAGTTFANVIKSTADKKVGGKSWIKLWEDVANQGQACPVHCYTDGQFYNLPGISCGRNTVGGHVLLNAAAAAQVLPNTVVHIIPICGEHNLHKLPGWDTGAGYYMILSQNMTALQLQGYLTKVNEYMDKDDQSAHKL